MTFRAVGLLTALAVSGGFGYYLYRTRALPNSVHFTAGAIIVTMVVMIPLWVAQQVTSHLANAVLGQLFLVPEGVCTVCLGALLVRRAARSAPPDTS